MVEILRMSVLVRRSRRPLNAVPQLVGSLVQGLSMSRVGRVSRMGRTARAGGAAVPTPPTILSGVVQAVTPDILALVFSLNMNDHDDNGVGFTLTASGGAVTITSSGEVADSIVLGLSRAILTGETLTLDYNTPPGQVTSTGGGILASFSGFSVTNNT